MFTIRPAQMLFALLFFAPRSSLAQTPPSIETVLVNDRVVVTERVIQSLVVGPDRFALVLIRCNDLIPRGGSDCYDRHFAFSRVELRAFPLAGDTPRWRQPVALPSYASPTMAVQGGRIVLTLRRRRWSFTIADGRP